MIYFLNEAKMRACKVSGYNLNSLLRVVVGVTVRLGDMRLQTQLGFTKSD